MAKDSLNLTVVVICLQIKWSSALKLNHLLIKGRHSLQEKLKSFLSNSKIKKIIQWELLQLFQMSITNMADSIHLTITIKGIRLLGHPNLLVNLCWNSNLMAVARLVIKKVEWEILLHRKTNTVSWAVIISYFRAAFVMKMLVVPPKTVYFQWSKSIGISLISKTLRDWKRLIVSRTGIGSEEYWVKEALGK